MFHIATLGHSMTKRISRVEPKTLFSPCFKLRRFPVVL
jgi:hypothetical protein